MSLYHYSQPAKTHQYSADTERHKPLAGIMQTPKRIRCSSCEQMRNAQTAVDGVCHYCRSKA